MDWQKYDAEKRPAGNVFLIAAPAGNDEAPGYEVMPGRMTASGKAAKWNGEPIPADSLIAVPGEVPKRTVEKHDGTRKIEDGIDKGPLVPTKTDRILEARNDPDGIADEPEPTAKKPAAKKK